MTEEEMRRKNDVEIATLNVQFKNFVERYERDIRGQNVQLSEIILTIKSHDEFIKDIRPVYAKGMMALGAAMLGSIGIGVHWLWRHVSWG